MTMPWFFSTSIEQRSPREAEAWYKQAAKVGNTSAKRNLKTAASTACVVPTSLMAK